MNLRLKIIKLLEEQVVSSLTKVLVRTFLYLTTKAKATKVKVNKWNYIK